MIDKYRQSSHVQRASLMSATLAAIRLRSMRLSSENFAAIQNLTTALVHSLTRTPARRAATPPSGSTAACDQRVLWRLGISGDRPVLLVWATVEEGLGLLRVLVHALRLWAWGGIACDLVVVNSEPASYQMGLQREITAMRERFLADSGAQPAQGQTQLHLLRAAELSADEIATLQILARVQLHADGRPFQYHLAQWSAWHTQDMEQRQQRTPAAVATPDPGSTPPAAPQGAFDAQSGEFRFAVGAALRPARPWTNVLANPGFGSLLTEAGGGYSWAVNSRLMQLTAWSNDPVADPPVEWFLLQDQRTQQAWSMTPGAWGADGVTYQVAHGQGSSSISHRCGDLEVSAHWCVDSVAAVKHVRLHIRNRGSRTQKLRLLGMVEWMMGGQRVERNTTHTSVHAMAAGTALLCTQQERSRGFGAGSAFLALVHPGAETPQWTCDRREFFDADGALVLPQQLANRQGGGLDPCAALSVSIHLEGGDSVDHVFLLGYGSDPDQARALADAAAAEPVGQRQAKVDSWWNTLLLATQVKTPDPLFDALVNRWLPYQTVACRLWAKAGFYQAGGATGFRDQLQDAMALSWSAPQLLREQILRCAARQFAQGDVQHWWHAPDGAGVRTRFSDDLLWLPFACLHYLQATGDVAVLDQPLPFIEGAPIPDAAEDAYYVPAIGGVSASLFEHAARTIDHSLAVGTHGLPLMGSGDWNDGMNRVGLAGRGESVWLAWFLCTVVAGFAPLARSRGEVDRAKRWETSAVGWKTALLGPAWDGKWFRRAFFDDGTALGSAANPEARIDLIAQAWAVLSGAAPLELQRSAMAAVEELLMDQRAGLIRLLDPPLRNAVPSAGYIQAYPAGVRENGGQYSHAGVWALMAQASMATRDPDDQGGADRAWRSFTWLSPAHRAANPWQGAVYGLEPYVMAGDTYSQAPYTGRGGWSWYTGAAAWMHRAAIESIFGLQISAASLHCTPCLPSHWPRADMHLRRDGRVMHFILWRGAPALALEAVAEPGAQLLLPGQRLSWPDLPALSCHIIPWQQT